MLLIPWFGMIVIITSLRPAFKGRWKKGVGWNSMKHELARFREDHCLHCLMKAENLKVKSIFSLVLYLYWRTYLRNTPANLIMTKFILSCVLFLLNPNYSIMSLKRFKSLVKSPLYMYAHDVIVIICWSTSDALY